MYLGTYVGQPVIWDWQLLPGEAGALSQEVVVNIGTPEDPKHCIMGFDNFYIFAGGRAVPIGNVTPSGFMSPVKETVFGELNLQYYYAAKALHDAKNSLVYFFYPVASSNMPDKCVVYNYRTNRWGRDDRQIEAALDFYDTGTTYDALGTSYATYNDLPALPYDLAFAAQGAPRPGIFNASHRPQTLTGAAVTTSLTLGDYGSENGHLTVRSVRPRFLTAPTAATFVNFYRDVLSASLTTDQSTPIANGRFDFLRSAHWHRGRIDMTGDWELPGMEYDAVADGET
jgi:hypothetical protein